MDFLRILAVKFKKNEFPHVRILLPDSNPQLFKILTHQATSHNLTFLF
jgi:hypothetical protein